MAGRFSIEAVFKAIDRFTRPLARMRGGLGTLTKNVSKGVTEANAAIDKMGAGLKRVGLAAAAVATGVGAVLFNIGKTGADFEEAITGVGAVGLQTRDQIAALEKKALELGSTTKFTATEAANAMEIMARAGFKNEEILAGVGGVLSAAAASGLEMAEVANHVSNVLKGMGLQASDAARVADVLALASARTNSSIGSLGESMKNLAPVARQLNVPMEQAVAAVALLQDVGLDASEAGTATATMLTKLAAPTAGMAKEMKKLGIAFQDSAGNALPLPEILKQFDTASKKSGGNMKVLAFFSELVGLRGQKAALNLKDLFASGKVGDLVTELEGAAGAAEKMAALKMANLKGDLTLLESAADGVKVALFGLESGPMRDIVQTMTKWVDANKEMIVSGVQGFLADMRAALPAIGDALERVGRAAKPLLAVVFAIKGIAAATALWTAAMAANPVTLWIVGLTALAMLVAAFWPEISQFFSNVWNGAKDMATRAMSWLKDMAIAVAEFIVGAVSLVMPAFRPAIAAIADGARRVMDNWSQITGFFSALWDGVLVVAKFAYDSIVSVFSPIVAFFSGLWDTVAGGFQAAFGWVLEKLSWAVKAARLVGRATIGGDDGEETDGAPAPGGSPSVVSPQERLAHSISETTNNSSAEITVKAPRGTAEITKKPKGGMGLTLQSSGAF